jgi:hypothetical protein
MAPLPLLLHRQFSDSPDGSTPAWTMSRRPTPPSLTLAHLPHRHSRWESFPSSYMFSNTQGNARRFQRPVELACVRHCIRSACRLTRSTTSSYAIISIRSDERGKMAEAKDHKHAEGFRAGVLLSLRRASGAPQFKSLCDGRVSGVLTCRKTTQWLGL